MASNHQVRLAARPQGLPKRTDFAFTESPVPEPKDGEVVVRVEYVSLDPAMRGWMNEGRSYIPPIELGAVFRSGGVGRVIASKAPGFVEGDWVSGATGIQQYAALKALPPMKIDVALAPPTTWLNALGMPGMTAYFGLFDVGAAKQGDTVVISGAAGAVGATAGQLAKQRGCRVIGIAGGAEKCAYLRELGFDAALDYKTGDLKAALKEACGGGIDVFFDNVGGDVLDLALGRLNRGARIAICGAISQYNSAQPVGPKNYLQLLVCRARMQGFVVFDYADRYGEAVAHIGALITAGKLKYREHVVKGIDTFPESLLMLFKGENFGKLVLQLQ